MRPLDPDADILLLLGRDILRVHKVRRQFNGPHNAPYAQNLDLGWVIIGDVCLGRGHRPTEVSAMKIFVLENGCPNLFSPCENCNKVRGNLWSAPKLLTNSHAKLIYDQEWKKPGVISLLSNQRWQQDCSIYEGFYVSPGNGRSTVQKLNKQLGCSTAISQTKEIAS